MPSSGWSSYFVRRACGRSRVAQQNRPSGRSNVVSKARKSAARSNRCVVSGGSTIETESNARDPPAAFGGSGAIRPAAAYIGPTNPESALTFPMPVRQLPETIVNRIAAGEVVERPASVVKELVENAIDAAASRIDVFSDGGGRRRITVTDDGSGMTRADLALAVERHATSKLDDEDLLRIRTLGFRGEALPSIGAVAKLPITTRNTVHAHASAIA